MKPKKYLVIFTTGETEIIITGGGYTEARILAQAEQIKAGNIYIVKSVFIVEDNGQLTLIFQG